MKKLLVVALLAGLALVVFLVTQNESPEVASLGTAGALSSTTDDADSLATTETREQRNASVLASSATSTAQPTELVIEVVDARTEQTVPGARVFVEREEVDELERRQTEERCGFSGPLLAPQLGREHSTDESGLVRVDVPGRSVTVWASEGHRHGEAQVAAGAAHVRVELVVGRCATVEVVDRLGRPAPDTCVAWIVPELDSWRIETAALTDEHGRVEFHELSALRGADARVRVATPFVRCDPEFLEFESAVRPGEPLRLLIDDSGTVAAHITDATGEPLVTDATLSLRVDPDAKGAQPFAIGLSHTLRTPSQDGRARFERVGLGIPLIVDAEREGTVFTERYLTGLRTPGDVLNVEVPLRRVDPAIVARLTDASGSPLSGWRCLFSVLRDDAYDASKVEEATTDDDGNLRVYFSTAYGDLTDVHDAMVTARKAGESMLRARVKLPNPRRAPGAVARDEYDLGTLTCAPDAFFCSGRVVDSLGDPVAGATLYLMRDDTSLPPADRDWREDVDALGQFVVAWSSSADELELFAVIDRNRRSQPIVATRGQRDLVLTVPSALATGKLTGQVLLPDGVSMHDVDLWVERVRDDGTREGVGLTNTDSGGFVCREIPAGLYDVMVDCRGTMVAHITAAEVRPGETTEMAPIDLRERVHGLRFDVVDERGAALGGGTVCEIRAGEYVHHVTVASDGRAVLPSLGATIDIVASAPGRRSRIFEGVSSGAKLELARGATAVIRAPSLGGAGAEFALAVELAYCDGDRALAFSDDVAVVFIEHDRATVALPAIGEYCVRTALLVHRKSGARFELQLNDLPIVTLIEAPDESVLSLPADVLAAALAEATKQ